ncbi:hypothetical protein ALC62_01689 [Cyphomyrmex costatus]|uniref:Uncharacterized protein n=1 Tax=Cyphomyrmex costatus TaxID=456900 RepID=A0A195D3L4_9HYME|nr:hypothetical protein ALC62_01689 [Cyphomyrmex costatus]
MSHPLSSVHKRTFNTSRCPSICRCQMNDRVALSRIIPVTETYRTVFRLFSEVEYRAEHHPASTVTTTTDSNNHRNGESSVVAKPLLAAVS